MSDFHVREATRDDVDDILKVRSRSFGPLHGTGAQTWWEKVTAETVGERMLCVVDGDGQVVGGARIRPFEQAWGGRLMPMGAVAGVYVDPRVRGRGVASTLMRQVLRKTHALGDPISALFPAAPGLYRSVGYEFGGRHDKLSFSAAAIRDLRQSADNPLTLRDATADDAPAVRSLVAGHYARSRVDGPYLHPESTWRRQLGDPEMIHYLALDGDRPVGFVAYALTEDRLLVEHVVGDTGDITRALWAVVGSGSSVAAKVEAFIDARDPLILQLAQEHEHELSSWTWMSRIIDLPRAVAARGFSPMLTARGSIHVEDPDLPHNTGDWMVSVADGVGTAIPGEPAGDALRLGPRGLAALWCGWTCGRLRHAGLASGGSPDNDNALDAVVACSPYLTEYF